MKMPYPMVLLIALPLLAAPVYSQTYPMKPIRLIVPLAPGGPSDILARTIGAAITPTLGQQVVVENRTGAAGIVGADLVAKSPADGYTILLIGLSTYTLAAALHPKLPFDAVKDLVPVTVLAASPFVLLVHPSLPVKTVKELIALAKARPGELNYASGGAGTHPQMVMEVMKLKTGINIVHIPYKGTAAGFTDLMTGQVQLSFTNPAAGMPHMKSGRLRALAVTSREPSRLLPGLPTIASAGLDGFEIETIFGLFAPAKTPEPVIRRLNQEVARVLNTPEAKERLFSAGVEAAPGAPDELAVYIRSDMSRMGKVIRDAGIRLD